MAPVRTVLLVAALAACHAGAGRAEVLSGKPEIVDGDELRIAGRRIRLKGVDAPDPAQTCRANGAVWQCGANATFALSQMVGRNWVVCRGRDSDAAGRFLGDCYVAGFEGPNLNAWMVRDGWAIADLAQTIALAGEEDAARAARRGLWRGDFVLPEEWRRGRRLPSN